MIGGNILINANEKKCQHRPERQHRPGRCLDVPAQRLLHHRQIRHRSMYQGAARSFGSEAAFGTINMADPPV
jgi:hypothetical protein